MSDKQALLEFQARLAERLQAARSGDIAAGWLAVRAGTARLLIPLSHAAEIFTWHDVEHVPHVHPWFLGVANLRGTLCGVVDLALFLGQERAPRSPAALAQCRLVGFNDLLELNCALLVDELMGMRTPDAFVRSTPPAASDPPHYGHAYASRDGEQWREVNLQVLAQQPAFLEIGA
jgi:twitching motility protein PilI